PKTPEGAQKLRATRAELAQLHPRYFSVTFGAGGSTQSGTRDTVLEISAEGHDAAPHLSCIGRNRDELRTMLREYQSHGIRRFVDDARKLGVDVPVVAGIMPITNYTQLIRFSDMCGAEIPRWIRLKLAGYADDTASLKAFGLDVVTQLCERLLAGGAPGLHFYTLNQAGPTTEIWQRLGLSS